MKLIRGLHNLRQQQNGCVLSIGNFDGLHLGHQALISKLTDLSAQLNLPATVQSFDPTPRQYFERNHDGHIRTHWVQCFRDQYQGLKNLGVNTHFLTRFDAGFAAQPAEDYVSEILVKTIKMKAIVVGDDFRFGAGRRGDIELLQKMGKQLGFTAAALNTVCSPDSEHLRVSSTALRAALSDGDIDSAAKMLGRAYSLSGRVGYGQQIGGSIGVPTANLSFRRKLVLRHGVYAVWAKAMIGGKIERLPAVANFGVRPSIKQSQQQKLEVHLLTSENGKNIAKSGADSLYGREMQVEFAGFIRDETKFESLTLLKQQIQLDIIAAHHALSI